ncbi:MAG: hypothetical protein ACK56O_06315, partial [Dolichospermum sp.]
REQGTGNREQGTGNREQGTGNREQGTGNREQGTGNREQGTGNREQETGNREQETGKRLRRERQPNGFGQLYFSLLMSVFFPHLLTIRLTVFDKNKTYVSVTKNDHPLLVVRALALILFP